MAIGELLFLSREVERLEEKLKATELELRKEKKRSELRLKQRNAMSRYYGKIMHSSSLMAKQISDEKIDEMDLEIEAEVKVV